MQKIIINDLVGAFEAGADHFGDAVHTVFRFLNDGINFGKSGSFANSWILDGELQLLNVSRNLIDVV